MNNRSGDRIRRGIAESGHAPGTVGKGKGLRNEETGSRSSDSLPPEAQRLLSALSQPGAGAWIDPTDAGSVIVHKRRGGVSVGGGRFALATAEALAREDLVSWQSGASGQKSLCLTETGRAHRRRADAPEPDFAFFHQHRETITATLQTEQGTRRVRVDVDESPLDWLRRRKGRDGEPMIDEASYQAGERLRTDIMLAGLLPGVTARWDAMPRSGGPGSPSDATDRMIAARQRIRSAFEAVGSDFSDLLMDLCGFLKGLELIERERQWPRARPRSWCGSPWPGWRNTTESRRRRTAPPLGASGPGGQ